MRRYLCRLDAQDDVRREMGLVGDKVTDHVVAQHLFVDGIGFDVLGEETQACLGRSHAFEGIAHALCVRWGADLGRGEMSDQRSAQGAVQAE